MNIAVISKRYITGIPENKLQIPLKIPFPYIAVGTFAVAFGMRYKNTSCFFVSMLNFLL